MNCLHCGANIPNNETLCPTCQVTTSTSNVWQNRIKRPFLVGAISVLLIGLVVFTALPPAPGMITITSQPTGANVMLDNKRTSFTTPCTLNKLTPGRHTIKCDVRGYHSAVRKVIVPAGKSIATTLTLKPVLTTGFLKLTSDPPGMHIVLDGQDTNHVTPVVLNGVKPGKHTVVLKLAGYQSWIQYCTIAMEQTVPVSVKAQKIPDFLIATSSNSELVTIESDNGSIHVLCKGNISSNAKYALSPDGKTIAVAHDSTLTLYDYTGTQLSEQNLENAGARYGLYADILAGIENIVWHPTKKTLLVSLWTNRSNDDQHVLTEYNTVKKTLRPISHYVPSMSLGDSLTVIASDSLRNTHNADSDQVKGSDIEDSGGAYSPDGHSIAFIRKDEIYIADANLKHPRKISNRIDTDGLVPSVRWSPDGKYLLCFVDKQGEDCKGYILQPDGTCHETIEHLHAGACWSPDGTAIAGFLENDATTLQIYTLQDHSWRVLLSSGISHNCFLAWGALKQPEIGEGKLRVESVHAGMKVLIDGTITGEVTPHVFNLSAGHHTISLQQNGESYDAGEVVVKAGKTVNLHYK